MLTELGKSQVEVQRCTLSSDVGEELDKAEDEEQEEEEEEKEEEKGRRRRRRRFSREQL